MNIVLLYPEIHVNTGNIGRTCVLTNTKLHLIKPLGFSLDAKEEDLRALELLLNRVVDLHDETIAKIGAPDGAKNPQLVRKFYADLKAKYNEEIEAVESELEKYISLDK